MIFALLFGVPWRAVKFGDGFLHDNTGWAFLQMTSTAAAAPTCLVHRVDAHDIAELHDEHMTALRQLLPQAQHDARKRHRGVSYICARDRTREIHSLVLRCDPRMGRLPHTPFNHLYADWTAELRRELVDALPTSGEVDLCLCGGGMRAMTAGLVVLDLLERRDVRLRHVSGVSGGTWAMLYHFSDHAANRVDRVERLLAKAVAQWPAPHDGVLNRLQYVRTARLDWHAFLTHWLYRDWRLRRSNLPLTLVFGAVMLTDTIEPVAFVYDPAARRVRCVHREPLVIVSVAKAPCTLPAASACSSAAAASLVLPPRSLLANLLSAALRNHTAALLVPAVIQKK